MMNPSQLMILSSIAIFTGCAEPDPGTKTPTNFSDCLIDDGDAIALEQGSRDVQARVPQLNRHAQALAKKLSSHPAVARVYYPDQCPNFRSLMRPGAGHGCLLSVELKGTWDATTGWDAGGFVFSDGSNEAPAAITPPREELNQLGDDIKAVGYMLFAITLAVGLIFGTVLLK